MNSAKMTNALLAVIAVLLLVQVIQSSNRPHDPHAGMNAASEGMPDLPEENPAPMKGGAPSGDPADFHPSVMVIGSLTCPNDASVTLSDPGCTGKDADQRRKLVEDAMAKNESISKVYDLVVEKFGEKALTEQAAQIRRSNKAKK
ncbi:MAG: hypothetical protein V1495_09585 [Pseudomonadota bacterium]